MKSRRILAIALTLSFLGTTAAPNAAHALKCYHKTNKFERKHQVESRCQRTAWAEIGGEQYAKFTVAVAAAVVTYGAASSVVFGVIAEELGSLAYDLGAQLGREAAAQILWELIDKGDTKVFNGVQAGYQAWNRAECCEQWPFGTQCLPTPNTHAFYVAWSCDGGPSAQKVISAYQQCLGRVPESQAVIDFHASYAASAGNQAMTRGICFSPEGRTFNVTKAYQLCLGRRPESQGVIDNWSNHAASVGYQAMTRGICFSPEGRTFNVTKAYQLCLGRGPESQTVIDNWSNHAANVGYEQMRRDICNSPEGKAYSGGL